MIYEKEALQLKRKKITAILILWGIIVISGITILNNTGKLNSIISFKNKNDIKLMNYKPAKKVNTSGFQVDKYDKTNIAGLINNNEVLTLTYKDMSRKSAVISDTSQYCSIYNLNTKSQKDFKDVNISLFYGLSPDKKYALYMEPAFLTKSTPEETKQVEKRGNLYRGLKVLNLFTGEVTTLIPDHSNGQFKWISNDKVWASFFTGWQIIGVDGKIYASGDYPVKGNDAAWAVGCDINDLGNTIDGKIYYGIDRVKPLNLSIESMDIKTKEKKAIFNTNDSLQASKQGDTIALDHSGKQVEISPGIYNSSSEIIILNSNGNIQKTTSFDGYVPLTNFFLSPDGSKAAYIDYDSSKHLEPNADPRNTNATLKIMDIKTGTSQDIIKSPYITNVIWSDSDDSLSFNSEKPIAIKQDPRKPYSIDDLKKLQDYENNILIKNENISSYVVTFDK